MKILYLLPPSAVAAASLALLLTGCSSDRQPYCLDASAHYSSTDAETDAEIPSETDSGDSGSVADAEPQKDAGTGNPDLDTIIDSSLPDISPTDLGSDNPDLGNNGNYDSGSGDPQDSGNGQVVTKNPCRVLAGGYNFASEQTMKFLLDHAYNGGEGITVVIPDRDLENDSILIEWTYSIIREVFSDLGRELGDIEIQNKGMMWQEHFYLPLERRVFFGPQVEGGEREEYRIKILEHSAESEFHERGQQNGQTFRRNLKIEINGQEFEYEFESECNDDTACDPEFHQIFPNNENPDESLHAFFGRYTADPVFASLEMRIAKGSLVNTKTSVRIPQDNISREYTVPLPGGRGEVAVKLRVQDDIENFQGNGVDVFIGSAAQPDNQQDEYDLWSGDFRNTDYGIAMVLKGIETQVEQDENGQQREVRYAVLDLYGTADENQTVSPLDFSPRRRTERPGDDCPPYKFAIFLGYAVPTIASTHFDEQGNEVVEYEPAERQPGAVRVAAQRTLRPLASIRAEELPDILQDAVDHRGAFFDSSTVGYTDPETRELRPYPQLVISGLPPENEGQPGDDNFDEGILVQNGLGRALHNFFRELETLIDD